MSRINLAVLVQILVICCLVCLRFDSTVAEPNKVATHDDHVVEVEKLIKGTRNAIFLLDKSGKRHQFPDFHTFATLGFDVSTVSKIDDTKLSEYELGSPVKAIPAPPSFRPDDFMYHELCQEPRRLIDDLSVVANVGDFDRITSIHRRIENRKSIEILVLGGSITAGGYYMEFVRLLQNISNVEVIVHNHGHGATGIPYTLYCVDFEKYKPDLVLVDFAVNDYGHPKLMDGLLRKVFLLSSNPLIVLVNLWVHSSCPSPRYLVHSVYYNVPLLNICPAANLCYGKRLPRWITEQYSTTDGVHPWGSQGVIFIGKLLYAWWTRDRELLHSEETIMMSSSSATSASIDILKDKPPMYVSNPIGECTRCDALVDDADARLTPIEKKGFHIVTRVKTGFGGFDGNSSTKSFKRSWQSDIPGSTISFRFYGSTVAVALWQRRDGMGVLHAYIDGDRNRIAKASGFFKGYSWAMERNNTGRHEIISLFDDLEDKEHVITFLVSEEPANVWVKGHTVQIFALLSASKNKNCKKVVLSS